MAPEGNLELHKRIKSTADNNYTRKYKDFFFLLFKSILKGNHVKQKQWVYTEVEGEYMTKTAQQQVG